MGSCLPCMRIQHPPRVGRIYISHPMEVAFEAYNWGESNWRCHRCGATWNVVDVSHAGPSVQETATHAGGQTFWWEEGDAGICPCGVLWTPREP